MDFFIKLFKRISAVRIFNILIIVSFITWCINLYCNNHLACIFLYHCEDVLRDFLNPINHAHNSFVFEALDRNHLWFCYSPFTYCFFRAVDIASIKINPTNPIVANYLFCTLYLTFSTMCLICLNFCNLNVKSNFDKVFFSMAVFFSGIYLYSLERANIILSVMLFLYYFVFFYNSKNKILKEIAVAGLAVATVLKVSPIVFAWLLFLNKDYKAIFRFLAYSLILFLLPCLFYPRGLESVFNFTENLKLLSQGSIASCVSGQGKYIINQILYCIGQPFPAANSITTLVCAAIGAFGVFTSFFCSKLWKKVLLLSLMLILIPSVSFCYTLLYFIPVLVLYFNDEKKSKWDYLYLVYFILIFNTYPILYYDMNKNISLIREIAVLAMFLQLFIENILIFAKNKMQYKEFIYCKFALIKAILKNKKQNKVLCKNIFFGLSCILFSALILGYGCYKYHKNYSYDEYKITDLAEIQRFETNKLTLKDDFSIYLECEFIPERPMEYENVFQTADYNDGLRFEISNDMNSAFLYSNEDKELTAQFNNKIEVGKRYRLKALISEKSFSTLFEEIPQTDGFNIELVSKVDKKTISKESIQNVIVGSGFSEERNFSGKVLSFDLKIKNGENSDKIVVLTLFGFLIPIFLLFYHRKIRRIWVKIIRKQK